MNKILILAAALVASFTSLAPPAFAQQAAGAGQVVVGYGDLDLNSRAGLRTLDRRIRTAVEQACGPISSFDPRGKNVVLDCREDTLALARAQRDTAIAGATGASQIQLASQR